MTIKFMCPVKSATLTSKYGMRLHPVLKINRLHAGIDLISKLEKHAPIMTSANGKVRLVKNGTTGYGKYVIITHSIDGKIYETVYAHLHKINVNVGQVVKMGDTIGLMGNTGIGTGVHLHFEIHEGTYNYGNGTYPTSVDPLKYVDLKNDKPSKVKEDDDMFIRDASSSTLKSNFINKLEAANKAGKIDIKWVKQAKDGSLSVVDMILLQEYIK